MYCGGQKDEDEKTLSGRESFVERGAKAVMPQACLPLQPGTASQMIFMMTRVEAKLGRDDDETLVLKTVPGVEVLTF